MSRKNTEPTDRSTQYKPEALSFAKAPNTASKTHPTVSTNSNTIMSTPSVIGSLSERRDATIVRTRFRLGH